MRLRSLFVIISLIIFSILFFACSSSSQSERYNKPKEKEETDASSVRFTSHENNDTSSFRDIQEEDDSLEFDEMPTEEFPVNTKEFVGKYDKMESLSSAFTTREKLLFEIIAYLDTPYKYGGIDRNGIDCSAFTKLVYHNGIGLELPRTARLQFKEGENISSIDDLQFGDLLFFNTTRRSYPGHVGIYIGENLFAHASRSLGVTVSSLESSYYKTRYIGARRVK